MDCLTYSQLWEFASLVGFIVQFISEDTLRLYIEGGNSFIWTTHGDIDVWCIAKGTPA